VERGAGRTSGGAAAALPVTATLAPRATPARAPAAVPARGDARPAVRQAPAAPSPASAALAFAGGRVVQRCACGGSGGEPCAACREEEQRRLQRSALEVRPADDPLEAEAERAADRVAGGAPVAALTAAAPALRRKGWGGAAAGDAPPSVSAALAASGRPLDSATRAVMEMRFGQDFGDVRVHTGVAAEASARDVRAAAYTVGSRVVFGAGRYRPEGGEGQRLLAHELAHVVQQRGSRPAVQRATDGVVLEPVRPAARACLVHLHGDEPNALATARGLYRDRCVNLAWIRHPGRRTVRVDVPGHAVACEADPNRVFEDAAIAALWGKWNTGACAGTLAAAGQAAVRSWRDTQLIPAIAQCRLRAAGTDVAGAGGADPNLPVVAFHNNTAAPSATPPVSGTPGGRCTENLTIRSYLPGHCESLATDTDPARTGGLPNPTIVPGQDIDDFILVTDPAEFRALRATRNVVLQSLTAPHDGSLSVRLSAGHYVNVEAQQGGPRARNRAMGVESLDALGVPPGPCPDGGTSSTQTGPGSQAAQSDGGTVQRSPLPGAAGALASPAAGRVVQRKKPVTSADLKKNPDAKVDRFMRKVYDAQVAIWKGRGASYFEGLAPADLVTLASADVLPGRTVQLEKEAASKHLKPLLADARSALSSAKTAGDPAAANVTEVRVRSGYRGAREQFTIWQREFKKYYKDTMAARAKLPGGEFGADAVQFLADYINVRVFSPGYSPHQHGRTVDFTYQERGKWAEADSSPAGVAGWKASWLFAWLTANAATYGFAQNPALNEPWHWELDLAAGPSLLDELWEKVKKILLEIIELLIRFFSGDPSADAGDAGTPDAGAPPDAGAKEPANPPSESSDD
jgi:hypothetical protein